MPGVGVTGSTGMAPKTKGWSVLHEEVEGGVIETESGNNEVKAISMSSSLMTAVGAAGEAAMSTSLTSIASTVALVAVPGSSVSVTVSAEVGLGAIRPGMAWRMELKKPMGGVWSDDLVATSGN